MKQPPTSFDPRATREYRELGFKIVKCPVCGKETLDGFFICPNCGWEYDGTIEENEYSSCNKATIVDYRKKQGDSTMCTKWKLTIKTSLPNVCYGEEDLVTSTFIFDDFETARAALRAKLREFAFSHNEMFDGYGSMIHMERYMDMIKREDEDIDDPLPEWFTGKIAVALLNIFSCIFEGKDVDISIPCGRYFNADIEADFDRDSITIRGTEEGVINGYDPKIDTNLLYVQEEKNYYLYIDDMFRQCDWMKASSELYIDLTKELDQLTLPI